MYWRNLHPKVPQWKVMKSYRLFHWWKWKAFNISKLSSAHVVMFMWGSQARSQVCRFGGEIHALGGKIFVFYWVHDFSVWPFRSEPFRSEPFRSEPFRSGRFGLSVWVTGHFGRDISVHTELMKFVNFAHVTSAQFGQMVLLFELKIS